MQGGVERDERDLRPVVFIRDAVQVLQDGTRSSRNHAGLDRVVTDVDEEDVLALKQSRPRHQMEWLVH